MKDGYGTGFYAFGRSHWFRVLIRRNELCAAAKKYRGFYALAPSDWRALLCSNFDFFEPFAAEFNAWGGFATSDWRELLVHFIRTEDKK